MKEKSLPDLSSFPILIVDDEMENLEAFEDEFGEEFTILRANSGEAALRILDVRPDTAIVLADQRMPRMTGVELLKEVRARDPRMVRMMITAYTDIDVVINAVNSGGIYRYVAKPWDDRELRMTLMGAIERFRLTQERDQLLEKNVLAVRQLERVTRLTALASLASGVAREVRSRLVSNKMFLECMPEKVEKLLRDGEAALSDDYWSGLRDIAMAELDRVLELLEELAGITQIRDLIVREQPVGPLIEQITELVRPEAEARGIAVECQFAEGAPEVTIDADKIKKLLLHLMVNGLHAMEKGGKLTIHTREAMTRGGVPCLLIEVEDTGTGIESQDIERIFEPFFSRKSLVTGSGLGLTICRTIVEAHRGEIKVSSEPGRGSTFSVYLPLDGEAVTSTVTPFVALPAT